MIATMENLYQGILLVAVAACAIAVPARLALTGFRPGSLLSAGILLVLKKISFLRNFYVRTPAPLPAALPVGLRRISNHVVLSLDIAAHFNAMILLMRHAFKTPEPLPA